MTRSIAVAAACLFVATPALASQPDQVEPEPARAWGWFENERGFSVKLEAAGAFRRVWNVPMYEGELAVSFGAQTKVGAFYGTLSALAGQTNFGLRTNELALGPSWEA